MSAAEEGDLLEAYFGDGDDSAAREFSSARFVVLKALLDLHWTLWGCLQVTSGNPNTDFKAYSEARHNRCRGHMASAEFDHALGLVAARR